NAGQRCPVHTERCDVKKNTMRAVAATAAVGAALAITGCSDSSGGDSDLRACIILPDAASSPRWENGDRPALKEAIEAAGFTADIQNAQGDTAKYATIADQQLSQGCGVMLLV